MSEQLIEVSLDRPGLRVKDREYLNEIISRANYNFAVGQLEELRAEAAFCETHLATLDPQTIAAEFAQIRAEVASNEPTAFQALDVELTSRQIRAEVLREYAAQVWALLGS